MELVFRDLCVDMEKKKILNDVSGMALSGQLLAVMGPSGAGKTTLMNTITGRVPVSSGTITLNGKKLTKTLRRKICYVLQQDIFFPNLTLHETLQFTAKIRLPDSMSSKEIQNKIDEIVKDLDLSKCLDTVIGDVWVRGLSGGEKKRVSIACELITDPVMILLDEPTSGLDYSTAFNLVQMLQNYAKDHNKTVIATIHQPSSYIFYQFEKLLLMSEGEVAYFGPTRQVADFFSKADVPMASHYNPADFILEKLKEDDKTRQKIVTAAYEMRKGADWPEQLKDESSLYDKNHDAHLTSKDIDEQLYDETGSVHISLMELEKEDPATEVNESPGDQKWPTGFFTQYSQLTIRTFKNSKSLIFNKFKLIETCVLCAIVSLIWFQLPRTEETLRDRMGVIFYMSMHWGFTPLFDTVTSFPSERIVINKERSAGWYRLSAYYLAKMTSELPLILVQPLFWLTVVYWTVGLNGVSSYFATIGTIFIHSIAGQSIGLFLGITFMDIQKGMTLATVYIMGTMLLGGFYTRTLPFWLSWIKYLSFLQYTFHCLMYLEFYNGPPVLCALKTNISETQFKSCSSTNSTSIPSSDVLEFYQVDLAYWQYLLPLFAFIIVFRTAGYLVLRFIQKPH